MASTCSGSEISKEAAVTLLRLAASQGKLLCVPVHHHHLPALGAEDISGGQAQCRVAAPVMSAVFMIYLDDLYRVHCAQGAEASGCFVSIHVAQV